jgi:hypothetical protein
MRRSSTLPRLSHAPILIANPQCTLLQHPTRGDEGAQKIAERSAKQVQNVTLGDCVWFVDARFDAG